MSVFSPINKLDVFRRLSNATEVFVGQLAQNKQGVYFQYDNDYLSKYHNLSPYAFAFNNTLIKAPSQPHQGLHGLFADSLPVFQAGKKHKMKSIKCLMPCQAGQSLPKS